MLKSVTRLRYLQGSNKCTYLMKSFDQSSRLMQYNAFITPFHALLHSNNATNFLPSAITQPWIKLY